MSLITQALLEQQKKEESQQTSGLLLKQQSLQNSTKTKQKQNRPPKDLATSTTEQQGTPPKGKDSKENPRPKGTGNTSVTQAGAQEAAAGNDRPSKFCPFCGGEVRHAFKFCRFCGQDVAMIWTSHDLKDNNDNNDGDTVAAANPPTP